MHSAIYRFGHRPYLLIQYFSNISTDRKKPMADLELIIGNKNYSSWSLRPWVFMKHYQINFKEKRVPLFTVDTNEVLREYDSDFKVPVLKEGGLVIWDTLSILEYLSEQYLDSKGWPSDKNARAVARSVSAEMHSSFLNVRNELPMNCRKTFKNIALSSAAEGEIGRIRQLWQKCLTEFSSDGGWLFGEYSIADAMFAPIALRLSGYSILLEPLIQQYVTRVLAQPCIIEWVNAGKLETEIIEEDEIKI